MSVIWLNGKIVDAAEATISVYDHGLLYGDGVFEGIRFYNGVAFRLIEHLKRLEYSAKALLLNVPYSLNKLVQATNEVIRRSGEKDGYIRMVITRGVGKLGINPYTCDTGSVFLIADTLHMADQALLEKGARMMIANTRRLGPDGLDPKIKSLNYLNHILAKIEAAQAGYDEAVLLNQAGYVTEGTVDNIFITREGCLQTPPVSDGALDGITRSTVIELAKHLNIPFQERHLSPYDLFIADECFLTGTGAELIPVCEIMGRFMRNKERPIYHQIQQAFHEFVRNELKQAS